MSVDGDDFQAWVESVNDAPGDQTAQYFATDFRESQKFDQFYGTSTGSGSSWWENLAKYGVTRAIDAHFGPSPVDKTMQGATYAGQNGQTYAAGTTGSGGNGLLLLALGLGLLYVVTQD